MDEKQPPPVDSPEPEYNRNQYQQQQQPQYQVQQQQPQHYQNQYQQPQQYQGQQRQPEATYGREDYYCKAKCAIVSGIFGVCGCCFKCGIAAIVLGAIASGCCGDGGGRAHQEERDCNRHMACIGVALGVVATVGNVIFVTLFVLWMCALLVF